MILCETVLVVDDDRDVAEAEASLVRNIGYRALFRTDPSKVAETLERDSSVAMILLDIRMPGMNGLEVLKQVKAAKPQVGVVMATVVNDIELAVRATKCGAYNYLLKPLQSERLGHVLKSYFTNRPRTVVGDPRCASFITAAPVFEEIFRNLKSFAETDVTLLIQGETGTGKELVAQIAHALSQRGGRRFLPVNVAAIGAHLFEGELFGYRRGAFTGAVRDHEGYLGAMEGGTLFLDEIGEMHPDHQTKLLRVLQSRTYCRLGETTERGVNGRLIVATNRELREDVRRRAFREDLYFRLAAHAVTLPPLRDRREDIDVLAAYFLRKYCSQFGRTVEGFLPETMERLRKYAFPGNVRELEGLVSSAVLVEQSAFIRPETLPSHVLHAEGDSGHLSDLRYREIMKALAESGGNQTKAAEKLGINRTTLHRFLKEYGHGQSSEL